jgi:hypothetical protein
MAAHSARCDIDGDRRKQNMRWAIPDGRRCAGSSTEAGGRMPGLT